MAEQPAKGPPTTPATAVGASAGTVTVGPPTTLTTSSGRMSGVKPTGSTPRSQQSPDGLVAVGSTVLTVNGRDASTLSEYTPITTPERSTSTVAGPAARPPMVTESRTASTVMTAFAAAPGAGVAGGLFLANAGPASSAQPSAAAATGTARERPGMNVTTHAPIGLRVQSPQPPAVRLHHGSYDQGRGRRARSRHRPSASPQSRLRRVAVFDASVILSMTSGLRRATTRPNRRKPSSCPAISVSPSPAPLRSS